MNSIETIFTVQYFSPQSRLGINQQTFSTNIEAMKFYVALLSNDFEAKVTDNVSSNYVETKNFSNYKFVVVKVTSAGPVCEWHKIKSKF